MCVGGGRGGGRGRLSGGDGREVLVRSKHVCVCGGGRCVCVCGGGGAAVLKPVIRNTEKESICEWGMCNMTNIRCSFAQGEKERPTH